MDRPLSPEVVAAVLDKAVEALCETLPNEIDEPVGDRMLLDLTKLEADVDTFKSTVAVLMKHLLAA